MSLRYRLTEQELDDLEFEHRHATEKQSVITLSVIAKAV